MNFLFLKIFIFRGHIWQIWPFGQVGQAGSPKMSKKLKNSQMAFDGVLGSICVNKSILGVKLTIGTQNSVI
jgi:hypothetical protein